MFNLDPKKMQQVMKQLGMKQEEIDAKRVIIEKNNGKIIIENPSVTKVVMQGQETFQIAGEISEEDTGEDIATIVEKTGVSEEQAKKALQDSKGDLAEAILSLS